MSLEIKSYLQKCPRKKSFSRKCMGTKDVFNLAKKGAIGIKNTPGYICRCLEKKSFL